MERQLILAALILPCHSHAQTVTDYDGNIYPTVTIGTQVWIAENIKVTHYADGSLLPDSCYPDGDPALEAPLGRLYTWAAATRSATVEGAQGVCPNGWHVPTDAEWMILIAEAGGQGEAAGHLKSASTLWMSPNAADNSTGFSALPAGNCYNCGTGGSCDLLSTHGEFWTSTPIDAMSAKNWSMNNLGIDVFRHYNQDRANGFSVRCLSNAAAGIEEHGQQPFRLSPNPSQGSTLLVLASTTGSAATVSMQDMLGRTLRSERLGSTRLLTIDDLPGGAYVITLADGDKRWQQRLVVQ